MSTLKEQVGEALAYVKSKAQFTPKIGMILGSGLGDLAGEVEREAAFPYKEIPNFPESTVQGHEGTMVLGKLEGQPVMVMKGRVHFYEGYPMTRVTFSVRLMKAMGASILIVTNAAGGINPDFSPGNLMIIEDHINMVGTSPLVGPNDPEMGPRFPDMTQAYNRKLRELAAKAAEKEGITLKKGVFVGLHGPNYETPAELRFMRQVGGDAVGMSTVPEVIVANHAGLKVLGISCITNVPHPDYPADHAEVLAAAEQVKPTFKRLIRAILREIE